MTAKEAIKQLQTEHDLIAGEHDIDGSQFAPALLEALAMAIEVLKCSEIPNCSEPKCADGCIYGWGSSECGHCDYRSEEPKTGDCISRKAAIDALGKEGLITAMVIIDRLPPAQPERPKGYMKIKVISAVDGEDLFCENCDAYYLSPSYNFCPKCGVEFIGVRGEQE